MCRELLRGRRAPHLVLGRTTPANPTTNEAKRAIAQLTTIDYHLRNKTIRV